MKLHIAAWTHITAERTRGFYTETRNKAQEEDEAGRTPFSILDALPNYLQITIFLARMQTLPTASFALV